MSVKYLDNTGTQYIVNKIKAVDGKIPTEQQIVALITNELSAYSEGIVTIVEELPQQGQVGKLYLVVDPSDSDVYIVYTWENNSFRRLGAKTFTLVVDSSVTENSPNPVSGGAVFTELGGKANVSHTHGSITNDGKLGTASRVVVTDSNKVISVSSVTAEELGYLSGVTSSIQTQLAGKANSSHTHTVSDITDLEAISNAEIDAMFTGSNS